MNTNITRGPKVCPSCGKENPPTAACCRLCATLLDGAIQTTPTPAWGEVRVSVDPDARPISRPLTRGWAAATVVGVAILVPVSAIVTFLAVCNAAVTLGSPNYPDPIVNGCVGIFLGLVAAVSVVVFILIIVFRRSGWR